MEDFRVVNLLYLFTERFAADAHLVLTTGQKLILYLFDDVTTNCAHRRTPTYVATI